MNKAQLKKFRTLLEEKREEIVRKAKQTLDEDMTLDADDLPDEMDLASSEYLQSFTFRLRGREKVFLDKINKALIKIDDGTFGVCEECEEEISLKRLEARPETTLCIRCKEDQERMEKDYGLKLPRSRFTRPRPRGAFFCSRGRPSCRGLPFPATPGPPRLCPQGSSASVAPTWSASVVGTQQASLAESGTRERQGR
jgi:DnaK suppressor protein